jgi:hypothetical protein
VGALADGGGYDARAEWVGRSAEASQRPPGERLPGKLSVKK